MISLMYLPTHPPRPSSASSFTRIQGLEKLLGNSLSAWMRRRAATALLPANFGTSACWASGPYEMKPPALHWLQMSSFSRFRMPCSSLGRSRSGLIFGFG